MRATPALFSSRAGAARGHPASCVTRAPPPLRLHPPADLEVPCGSSTRPGTSGGNPPGSSRTGPDRLLMQKWHAPGLQLTAGSLRTCCLLQQCLRIACIAYHVSSEQQQDSHTRVESIHMRLFRLPLRMDSSTLELRPLQTEGVGTGPWDACGDRPVSGSRRQDGLSAGSVLQMRAV
jgi:hypothetical protein